MIFFQFIHSSGEGTNNSDQRRRVCRGEGDCGAAADNKGHRQHDPERPGPDLRQRAHHPERAHHQPRLGQDRYW